MNKKKNNIINFPSSVTKMERKLEAILFAASEPLDIETIEKRLQTSTNTKKSLETDGHSEQLQIFQIRWLYKNLLKRNYQKLLLKHCQLSFTTNL